LFTKAVKIIENSCSVKEELMDEVGEGLARWGQSLTHLIHQFLLRRSSSGEREGGR